MISSDLLNILCCPETKQELILADSALIDRINTSIPQGKILTRSGKLVSEPIGGGLIRQDRKFLYPIRGDIPIMLIDEAFPMDQFGV